ncbi:MAG: rod shape-determining protein [Proteobacteria bacterium]|nr:rod shape-determining protein [Pseudomonadota bacterium]
MINKLKNFLGGKNLAMDLGTANTLLFVPGVGIVVNEPSVVAVDTFTNVVIAVGTEAKTYMGRAPDRIKVIRPIRDGVIADYEATRQMVTLFVSKAVHKLSLLRPLLTICVPMGITQVEKRAVRESGLQGGARDVKLIVEPLAAAIGAGLPVKEPIGSMVLDIGGGTAEVAVISLSNIAFSESVRTAGDALNESIQRYFQENFQLLIGENMAEEVKIEIGSAIPLAEPLSREVYGKSMLNGSPTKVLATDENIRLAMVEPLNRIVDTMKNALEKTSPELVADIHDNGLLLVGGGALLKGLDVLLSRETNICVHVDEDPLTTVVRGTGKVLDKKAGFGDVFLPE